ADFWDDLERFRGFKSSQTHRFAQAHPINEFHQQIKQSVRLAEIENGDDVRVVQFRQYTSLARKTFSKGRIASEALWQDFERDEAVKLRLAGFKNAAHATLPYHFNDL